MSAALQALRLGKDFTFYVTLIQSSLGLFRVTLDDSTDIRVTANSACTIKRTKTHPL